jgi:hypothetical protein
MDLLDRQLGVNSNQGDIEFIRVRFNPWLYRDEKNLLIPFLHTLRDQLEASTSQRLLKSAKKLGTILTEVGASVLLKTATVGQVTLKDLEEREKKYMARNKRATSTIRLLRTEMEEVVGAATGDGKNARLVFLIDDLDRCDPFQVLDLLESVKLFLDQRYCFFLLAMDEEVVSRGIQIKYSQYQFSDERKALIGSEFLDKMIQLPVYLYPLAPEQIRGYIEQLPLPDEIKQQAHSLAKAMLPNPRKIKRICNLISLILSICAQDERLKRVIVPSILGKLILLQVQEPTLYHEIGRIPALTRILTNVLSGKMRDPDKLAGYQELGELAENSRDICLRYLKRGGWIKELFTAEPFFPESEQLAVYLTMLSRGPANT